jgi:hypothetical protein
MDIEGLKKRLSLAALENTREQQQRRESSSSSSETPVSEGEQEM